VPPHTHIGQGATGNQTATSILASPMQESFHVSSGGSGKEAKPPSRITEKIESLIHKYNNSAPFGNLIVLFQKVVDK